MRCKVMYYIAAQLKDYLKVIYFRDKYKLTLSYDWAQSVKNYEHLPVEEIAEKEYKGVVDCDTFILIGPGGRDAHFELGVGYANSKRIIILEDGFIPYYTLPGIIVVKTEEELNKLL